MRDGEFLAVIRGVGYGNRDVGKPCLWFTTYISETTGALHVFTGDEANQFIRSSGVYDIRDLDGKACIVRVGETKIEFVRVARFPRCRTERGHFVCCEVARLQRSV